MEWGFAHESKNLEWNGGFAHEFKNSEWEFANMFYNSKWKRELAIATFFNSEWNGNFPINNDDVIMRSWHKLWRSIPLYFSKL